MQASVTDMDDREEVIIDGIYDNLLEISYQGPLLEGGALKDCIEKGLDSELYMEMVTVISLELKRLCALQETVSRPQGPGDNEAFQLEMRSFLKELHCPHELLLKDLDLLSTFKHRLLLVDFLLSELLAARLVAVKKKSKGDSEPMEVDGIAEGGVHSVSANLEAILRAYSIKNPPAHITAYQVFDRIIAMTQEQVVKCPKGHLTPGLVSQPLTEDQWAQLDQINAELTKEYAVRREMLLTRCDVTVQSFRWSDKIKGKEEEFTRAHQSRREAMSKEAPVSMARVLAAKDDLLVVEKTNSDSVRRQTQSVVNKVLVGKVPDRGGRPQETRPPPEMPSFRKRTEPPKDQRGGGTSGRGHGKKGGGRGGGRVQGGWAGGGGGRGSQKGGGGSWQGHPGYQEGSQKRQKEKSYHS